MSNAVLFYGWNRAIPGREKEAAALFQEYIGYLGGLKDEGMIDSFDVVLLTVHGGDMNGFFLVRGETAKLDEIRRTNEFNKYMTLSGLLIDGGGLVPGVTGDAVFEQMALWTSLVPG